MNDMAATPLTSSAEILRAFLRDLRTLAAVSEAELGLGDRLEATDPDRALTHLQASVAADEELVALITGPRGQACLNILDRVLRSGVVA
jgi:hypothetical protein